MTVAEEQVAKPRRRIVRVRRGTPVTTTGALASEGARSQTEGSPRAPHDETGPPAQGHKAGSSRLCAELKEAGHVQWPKAARDTNPTEAQRTTLDYAHPELRRRMNLAPEPIRAILAAGLERRRLQRVALAQIVERMEKARATGGPLSRSTEHDAGHPQDAVRLEKRLPAHLEGRQERVLEAWERQQQEWRGIRQAVASNSNKLETQLLMESGHYYRDKVEQMEQLALAVPLHERLGADRWAISLRNSWTRFLPVGHRFSGLYCYPVERRASDHGVARIRNPDLEDELRCAAASRARTAWTRDARRLNANRKATRPASASGRRTWVGSPHLDHRRKQYAGQLEAIEAHSPTDEDFRRLQIRGYSILDMLREMSRRLVGVEEVEKDVRKLDAKGWVALTRFYTERQTPQANRESLVVARACKSSATAHIPTTTEEPRCELSVRN
eukprot:scaffold3804_cov381-Prasinococcus_capsulatus_cf.AAC.5